MPSDTNVSLKIFEKLSKYKDLEIGVTKTWHLKTTALPVVIDVLGMVAKTTPNYTSQIPETVFNTHGHRTYSAKSTINVILYSISNSFLISEVPGWNLVWIV